MAVGLWKVKGVTAAEEETVSLFSSSASSF